MTKSTFGRAGVGGSADSAGLPRRGSKTTQQLTATSQNTRPLMVILAHSFSISAITLA
jgi:hypothetical protein